MTSYTDRAIQAYFRRFGDNANQPAMPIEQTTVDGKRHLILSNTHGVLAVYRVTDTGRLRFVEPDAFFVEGAA